MPNAAGRTTHDTCITTSPHVTSPHFSLPPSLSFSLPLSPSRTCTCSWTAAHSSTLQHARHSHARARTCPLGSLNRVPHCAMPHSTGFCIPQPATACGIDAICVQGSSTQHSGAALQSHAMRKNWRRACTPQHATPHPPIRFTPPHICGVRRLQFTQPLRLLPGRCSASPAAA